MNVRHLLTERFDAAFAAAGAAGRSVVVPAGKPEFGDYQANGVMAAAKRLQRNPRELAAEIAAAADVGDIVSEVQIAGPGFLNITLSNLFLAQTLANSPLLVTTSTPRTVVVDYSSPNLAKEMHVGHLRSTIIGDAAARVFEALGHHVIRQNHVGDWGTQFGMLLAHLEETGENSDELADLENFYRAAKNHFDADPQFAEQSRRAVVDLQAGKPEAIAQWRKFIRISLAHCQATYDRLGTTLTERDVMAESAYNDDLAGIVRALDEKGILVESNGARCVFLDEFKGKDNRPLPVIVQKSDGGYLYATTDLAAVRHRARKLHADRVLYLTDARQGHHFRQIFALAALAGFADANMSLEHHPFGNMLGRDGTPFKTRDGGIVKLNDLLDEAEARALEVVAAKNPALSASEQREIARAVGIGAVKYADLSKNRISDYVFDWDQMLSFDGNTAPYLQYAYARIQSIFRRGGVDPEALEGDIRLPDPHERKLAVELLRFSEIVEQVAEDVHPHHLCAYLFELAAVFMRFYEACPILTGDASSRPGRLALCRRTAQTLKTGLGLLGIDTIERM